MYIPYAERALLSYDVAQVRFGKDFFLENCVALVPTQITNWQIVDRIRMSNVNVKVKFECYDMLLLTVATSEWHAA